jgi:glycosyltransferase involved in cell wall biosynthesis
MDLLYVSSIYPPAIGGAQLQLHYLAKAMKEAGERVNVLTYTARNREDWLRFSTVSCETEARYEYEGVPVTRIGFPWSTRLRMLPWAAGYYAMVGPAARRIAALTLPHLDRWCGRPDLIHLTRIGREFIARACLDYARDRGIPFVLTPNHHPRWRGWRYVEYDRIYRESDALIVYTDAEKKTLVEDIGVEPDRIFVTGVGPVVSHDYSVEEFRAKHHLPGPYVLFLGQQYKYKGMEAVLRAAETVWKTHPDVRFVFIGPHTNFSQELFRNVSDPRVLNLGAVDSRTKAAALAGCAFLCMPSVQESFGGVYIEAWCYRKAVIAGDIPPIACVVDHEQNGLLSSQEPGELAAAINRLLGDPERCERMGEAGWRKVQEKYSWEQLARKTRAAYEQICGKRG